MILIYVYLIFYISFSFIFICILAFDMEQQYKKEILEIDKHYNIELEMINTNHNEYIPYDINKHFEYNEFIENEKNLNNNYYLP